MSVINMNQIEKLYGITRVLQGFSLFVNDGERVGLIGPNGSGKTTVFKIIAGLESYSGGRLAIRGGTSIGYLSQLPEFNPDVSLYEELETVFGHLIEMEERLRQLEDEISQQSRKAENDNLDKIMTEYSQLQHRFELEGGYQYRSKIEQVALGMGFSRKELEQPVQTLSGGEKTRLGLVKLLLTEPDILLLDEPTNHLDLPSIQWLEGYLQEYSGAVIIVSHDRYFLDEVVERIVELKQGTEEVYAGNYSYYLEERKQRYERRLQAYQNQQKKINKMEEAIDRLNRWGRQGDNEKFFKRARSMQKALDKMERLDRPVLDGRQMGLELTVNQRSGNEVLRIKDLSKSFGEDQILSDLELDVYWGEKIAVIGRNGSGKTTLIKLVLDEIKPDKGAVKLGANVTAGYYSQEFEGFNPEDDMITALRRECDMSTAAARNALATFLFTEDEVFKKVSDLSGGEKSRLRLLQLMSGDYNFLLLDEPTNHLDLPSREILEESLMEYSGTILVVSHDRYFLNKLIDYTYELEHGRLTKYYGNYDYYRRKKAELNGEDRDKSEEVNNKKSDYHRLKEEQRAERRRQNHLQELEEEIEQLEGLQQELESEMTDPENLDDFNLLQDLKERYEAQGQCLQKLYAEWSQKLEEG